MSDLDDHGQPKERAFNWKQNLKRDTEHLLGLAHGMVADGRLDPLEVGCLVDWLNQHWDVSHLWPGKAIRARVDRMLEDGVIDAEERQELFDLLRRMVGPDYPGAMASTELPFADPGVQVFHSGFSFCATGKFAYGPRGLIEKEIEKRGGFVHGMVTLGTDYLVIGSVGSRDWKHSSYGNKIEKAATYREKGSQIAIVGEDRWAAALEGDTA